MQVAKHKVVSLNYKLTDDAGDEIDRSTDGPLLYLHGAGALVPGLENALDGKSIGDELKVSLTPQDGYGERDEKLCSEVNREHFEGVDELEVGMQFFIPSDDGGEDQFVFVTAVSEETVTIDGNHPLAGIHLVFDVAVVDIREATAEEIEHGHAHGPGGHENDHE